MKKIKSIIGQHASQVYNKDGASPLLHTQPTLEVWKDSLHSVTLNLRVAR